MWVIFVISVIGFAFIGLFLWWIGNKIYLSIRRENRRFDLEDVGFQETKKKMKKAMEEKE